MNIDKQDLETINGILGELAEHDITVGPLKAKSTVVSLDHDLDYDKLLKRFKRFAKENNEVTVIDYEYDDGTFGTVMVVTVEGIEVELTLHEGDVEQLEVQFIELGAEQEEEESEEDESDGDGEDEIELEDESDGEDDGDDPEFDDYQIDPSDLKPFNSKDNKRTVKPKHEPEPEPAVERRRPKGKVMEEAPVVEETRKPKGKAVEEPVETRKPKGKADTETRNPKADTQAKLSAAAKELEESLNEANVRIDTAKSHIVNAIALNKKMIAEYEKALAELS